MILQFEVDSGLSPPPPCEKCGYLTGILDKIPVHKVPRKLVRSTYIPDEDSRSSIQDVLVSSADAIHTLEAEVSKLKQAVSLIEYRISNIVKFQKFQKSLLSPLRRIPDEILQEIFAHVCCDPIDIGTPKGPIWDIQQVCMRWRRVVMGTPELWASFAILKQNVPLDTIQQRVQRCLTYSKAVPLSISLGVGESNIKAWSLFGVITDIANHSDRWASIAFDQNVFGAALIKPHVQITIKRKGLFQLRKLAVHGDMSAFRGYAMLKTAKALEVVKFIQLTSLPKTSVFPWSRITNLTISNCSLIFPDNNIIPSFSAMSALEELTWDNTYCHISTGAEQLDEDITLPSLHTLSIHPVQGLGEDNDGLSNIWNILRTPKLSSIRIAEGMKDFGSFMLMIQRSACIIKKLQLNKCTTSFFLKATESLNGVEELSLKYTEEISMVLSMLVQDHADSVGLLPFLTKLELDDLMFEDVLHLKDVILSRSTPSAKLTEQLSSFIVFPLLHVKCTVWDFADIRYRSFLGRLHRFAEGLGVNVEIRGSN